MRNKTFYTLLGLTLTFQSLAHNECGLMQVGYAFEGQREHTILPRE